MWNDKSRKTFKNAFSTIAPRIRGRTAARKMFFIYIEL